MSTRSAAWVVAFLIGTGSAMAGAPVPQTDFFVQNEGQWEGAFAFKYEGNGAAYFLTQIGMAMDLRQFDKPPRSRDPMDRMRHEEEREPISVRGHVLRLSYLYANPTPILTGENKLSSYSNYFLSRDSCKWKSRVGHYRSVTAKDVWPGIDVQYRIATHGIETVYHLRPGADASLIQLRYEGQEGAIGVDANGSLLLSTSLATVTEAAPFAYQNINHTQIEIPCRYDLTADGGYRFVLGPYDPTREVVIDPLVYCSYWGGYGELELYDIAEDGEHHKLLTGHVYYAN
ncbi:MAG TPA: hypothetical protein VGL38_06060, partial [bacterium]